MTIKANSKIVRERIGINRFAIEIQFHPFVFRPRRSEASGTTVNFEFELFYQLLSSCGKVNFGAQWASLKWQLESKTTRIC